MIPAPFRQGATLALLAALAVGLAACGSGTGSTGDPTDAPGPSVGDTACPTEQPAALPAGETREVTIATELGEIVLTIEADLSPIAAGNFIALAECGYYDGVVFHRLVPGFVIQGGDPTGTGTGGPGYTIEDELVSTDYGRGTVAMARTSQPDSVGSQFFIVLDDEAGPILSSYNTYQIIGRVTSGMETVDAIARMPNSGGQENRALEPVVMDAVTVTEP